MSRQKSKETFYFMLAMVLGALLTVSASVWATSLGTNISSSGSLSAATTLSVTGKSTLSGGILVNNATSTITWLNMINATSTNATSTFLGVSTHASTSALRVSNATTFDGSLTYTNVGTTTIATNANAWSYATSSASIPLVKFDASNTRIGIGTTTPGATFAVGGDGTALIMGGGATSTLAIQSNGAGGGCIELEAADGNGRVAIYASIAATTTLMVQSGGCR